ncbi:MAG: Ig-like domain-containing protein [Candidatus Thorarchaeota archaeon]
MKKKAMIKIGVAGLYALFLITSFFSAGKGASSDFSVANTVPVKNPAPMPVVLIDMGHENAHSDPDGIFYAAFAGDAKKFSSNLTEWGFEVRFLETTLSASDLTDVDIFMSAMAGESPDSPQATEYTSAEVQALQDWFNEGNKSVWIAGDSDFDDDVPLGWTAHVNNKILLALGSNAMVEKASVESEDNFKASYRVKASVYNTVDEIPAQLLSTAKHGGAEFHGPAPVVGYNYSSGNPVALETPEADAYFKARNLYWVVKATNNATHPSTLVYNTPTTNWSVHTVNAHDNFVMMTAQELGPSNSCKIVVTGEAPWTTFKHMFHDPGELAIPQDQYYIVKEVIHWFATPGYEATCQAHIITPEDGSTTIEPEATIEGIAKGDTIASLEVYIDGTLETTIQQSYATVNLVDDLGLKKGTYNLTIVATSGEGIVSAPDTSVFTLDIEEEEQSEDSPGFEILTITIPLVLLGGIAKRKRR